MAYTQHHTYIYHTQHTPTQTAHTTHTPCIPHRHISYTRTMHHIHNTYPHTNPTFHTYTPDTIHPPHTSHFHTHQIHHIHNTYPHTHTPHHTHTTHKKHTFWSFKCMLPLLAWVIPPQSWHWGSKSIGWYQKRYLALPERSGRPQTYNG